MCHLFCLFNSVRNLRKLCNYSGVVQERNDCAEAHSQEELEEWKERHEYRMMKIAKAKEQRLYSFVDELLAEYNQSSNAEYEVVGGESLLLVVFPSPVKRSRSTALPGFLFILTCLVEYFESVFISAESYMCTIT